MADIAQPGRPHSENLSDDQLYDLYVEVMGSINGELQELLGEVGMGDALAERAPGVLSREVFLERITQLESWQKAELIARLKGGVDQAVKSWAIPTAEALFEGLRFPGEDR